MLLLVVYLLLAVEIVPRHPDVVYQQPQIASDGLNAGIVFGAKNTIYHAYNDAPPLVVAEAPGLSLGNHRGPRLAFTANAIVVTAGVGPADRPYGPNTLRSWRSTDHGKTWIPGPDLSTPGTGGMGFQALASDGKQRLFAAWIGPRDGEPRLFVAHSDDAGLTWSKQSILSQTVCDCCHPSVTISADGAVRILFRNSLQGNRDLYLASALDGQHFEIAKLGQGSWPLNACPMDGGGLAEFQGAVITLWRRESDLFLARPNGQPEERLATGKNPAVALRKNGVLRRVADLRRDHGESARQAGICPVEIRRVPRAHGTRPRHRSVGRPWQDPRRAPGTLRNPRSLLDPGRMSCRETGACGGQRFVYTDGLVVLGTPARKRQIDLLA